MNRKQRRAFVRKEVAKDIVHFLIKIGFKQMKYTGEYVRWERNGFPLTEEYLSEFKTKEELTNKLTFLQ